MDGWEGLIWLYLLWQLVRFLLRAVPMLLRVTAAVAIWPALGLWHLLSPPQTARPATEAAEMKTYHIVSAAIWGVALILGLALYASSTDPQAMGR